MPSRSFRSLIAVAIAVAALDAGAADVPSTGPVQFDGHYYEVVVSKKISWEAAKAAAESRTHNGIQGRLAKIESLAEDRFIEQLRQQALNVPELALYGPELWVGGHQVACATATPEPGCGWLWTDGDPISPTNTSSPYTNWAAGQPNNVIRPPDAFTRASEDHLSIGYLDKLGWNDQGDLGRIFGYVVEYSDAITIPAETCTEAGGCNPTGAQIQQFPDTAKLQDGATLTSRTFRIHDDPARCGVHPLTLFGGAIVIPPYLCGHPEFIVIESHTSGVEILSGTIDVENLTEEVLPGNLYGCNKVRQNPAGAIDPDPSHRDVVAWQTSDPLQMLETTQGTGRFFGTVAEVTYGCGSSRGKIVGGSYHFVGLRIHPGVGNEFADGNKKGNHQSFVELTRYKLDLLRASVIEAKAAGALSKKSYSKLKNLVDEAISFHEKRKYAFAAKRIKQFVATVEATPYKPLPGENFNGDHAMRGSNLQFMYAEKVIPFAW
jgi:hypothetical protein